MPIYLGNELVTRLRPSNIVLGYDGKNLDPFYSSVASLRETIVPGTGTPPFIPGTPSVGTRSLRVDFDPAHIVHRFDLGNIRHGTQTCLLYTSPSPRD